MNSGYGYAVGAYHSAVYGAVHVLCSTEESVRIEWPFKDREAHFSHQRRLNIIQCSIESMAGTLHAHSSNAFATDIVAALVDIIAPKIHVGRGGSISGLSTNEIADLVRVQCIMKEFGLSFRTKSNESGLICYKCNKSGQYFRS